MTVSSTVTKQQYTGNGVTTTFPFSEFFFLQTDLTVTEYNPTTNTTSVKVLNTDYTITGTQVNNAYPNGGNVNYVVAPISGNIVTISRKTPQTQSTNFVSNDNFPAQSFDDALDRLTLLIQELQEQLTRTPQLPIVTTLSSLSIPLPTANAFIAWDPSGTSLVNVTQVNPNFTIPATAGSQNDYVKVDPTGVTFVYKTPTQVLTDIAALPLAGGTLTGFLTLNADPTSNLHAASKHYVDNLVPSQGSNNGKFLETNGTNTSWGTPAFGKPYISGNQAFTSAGTLALTHGLGAAPSLVLIDLVCGTSNAGFTAGDVVDGASLSITTGGNAINYKVTSTQIIVNFLTAPFYFDTAGASITIADWTANVRAYL